MLIIKQLQIDPAVVCKKIFRHIYKCSNLFRSDHQSTRHLLTGWLSQAAGVITLIVKAQSLNVREIVVHVHQYCYVPIVDKLVSAKNEPKFFESNQF